ncbi:MAG: transposase [bacterium]|nr:transposase [bacterium]
MRPQIVPGNIYHILNRGVDKRKIFLDDMDYLRFIHDLFEFNDENPSLSNSHLFKAIKTFEPQYSDLRSPNISREPRKLLVEILVFCLMPNHYHLMVRPLTEKGLVKFIKKLNIGYANYFNQKYERSGALFQGRYKSIAITNDAHFIHLPYYIHMNPLDLYMPEWRKRELKDYNNAFAFLEKYRWSSFQDYIGKKNFPSITQRDFLLKFFNGPEEHKKSILKWLKDFDPEETRALTLE